MRYANCARTCLQKYETLKLVRMLMDGYDRINVFKSGRINTLSKNVFSNKTANNNKPLMVITTICIFIIQ